MNKELIQAYYTTCCDHSALILLILLTHYLISLSSNIPSNYSAGPSCPMILCSTTCHASPSSFIYLKKIKAVSQSTQKTSVYLLSFLLIYFQWSITTCWTRLCKAQRGKSGTHETMSMWKRKEGYTWRCLSDFDYIWFRPRYRVWK